MLKRVMETRSGVAAAPVLLGLVLALVIAAFFARPEVSEPPALSNITKAHPSWASMGA